MNSVAAVVNFFSVRGHERKLGRPGGLGNFVEQVLGRIRAIAKIIMPWEAEALHPVFYVLGSRSAWRRLEKWS